MSDPVAVALDRLAESGTDVPERASAPLVAVLEASRSLTTFVLSTPGPAVGVLADLDRRPELADDDVVTWKRLELLRVAARDLTGGDRLEETGGALAMLAADVLGAACRLAGVEQDVAVIGMGKLGGEELNYASDVDVLFVGGDDAAARAVLDVARRCFRVDADLRPEGRDGPLTRSLESYEAYWDRWAEPWEFQALMKARPVAGDVALGKAFAAAATRRVWERRFTADDIRSLRAMKARAEGEVARRRLSDREIKRGRGGIRDVEFAVQLLQLVHGRHDPGLRSPNTIEALAELSGAGYVDPPDAGALEDAYRFLRAVEHRLQLVDEAQVHAVPADAGARGRLARVMGYRDAPEASGVERFDADLRRHQATVRSIHERLYFRPLLEAFAGTDGRLSASAAEERLAAFGFTDAERTRQALRELTGGLTRSSRLMQQLLPLLLEWLSGSPDPDLGLLGLRRLATGPQRATELVPAFRESPEAARRLCTILGTSPLLAEVLTRNPDLIGDLGDDAALARSPRVGGDLRRAVRREHLRIAARDVLGQADVRETGEALSDLADEVLRAALAAQEPSSPFAVVALGRLGGRELSYASDLDVLFVHDGDAGDAEQVAAALVRTVGGETPARRVYELDADLRPEGRSGPLSRSLDSYRAYYERWADTWELQALVRARPVAGDPDLAAAFMTTIEPFVWRDPFPPEAERDIRRMKARVERERVPHGDDAEFHLKLGKGSLSDVEWTVQLLQLRSGTRSPGTMAALHALVEGGVLDPADGEVLAEAYRFCERTRNRWFLVKGSRGDSLPRSAERMAVLARSLGTTSMALREQYRRVTRRARAVVEREFYGRQLPR